MPSSFMRFSFSGLLTLLLTLTTIKAFAAEDFYSLYQLAKQVDTGIKRSETRLYGAKADSLMVRSALLPHLTSSLGLNYSDQTTYNQTTTSSAVMGFNYGVNAYINALNMPTILNRKAAAKGELIEIIGGETVRQDLMVRFADAYFGLLKAQLDLLILQDETVRVKKVLEQNEAFLKAGTGDIIAVYEATARYDSVIADLNRYESNLKLAEQKLSTLTGKPVSSVEDYTPGGTLGPQPDDISWWLSTMEKSDPQIRQMRESLEKSQIEVKSIKAEYYPVVQASTGYAVSKGALYAPSAEYHQWTIGANISLPLYSGGETSAKTQRANASERERSYLLEETVKSRSENLKQSFFNLKYNSALLVSLEQRVKSAETQLNAVRLGRTIGTRSSIDALNSEQAYSVALRDYKSTLYDNIIKQIQLKSAAGILEESSILPQKASGLVPGTEKLAEAAKEIASLAMPVKPVEPARAIPVPTPVKPVETIKESQPVFPAQPVETINSPPQPIPVKTVESVKQPVPTTPVKPVETSKIPSPPAVTAKKPRNQTGIGVLIITKKPGSTQDADNIATREQPGAGAISQAMVPSLSRFKESIINSPGEYHINVFEKSENWLKVVVSETGRAVWVQLQTPFRFVGWKEYFSGRTIRMNPGLPNEFYIVSSSNGKEKLGVVTAQDTLTVISVIEDWALVKAETLPKGWLRWRNMERESIINTVD